MLSSIGKITVHRNWWITLDPYDDIGELYRYFYNKEYKARVKIQKPKWGCHVTAIRSEKPLYYEELFGSLQGKELEFHYDVNLKTGFNHVWLDVECSELLDLREFFGLPRNPKYNLHLTIGYIERIYNLKLLNEIRLPEVIEEMEND